MIACNHDRASIVIVYLSALLIRLSACSSSLCISFSYRVNGSAGESILPNLVNLTLMLVFTALGSIYYIQPPSPNKLCAALHADCTTCPICSQHCKSFTSFPLIRQWLICLLDFQYPSAPPSILWFECYRPCVSMRQRSDLAQTCAQMGVQVSVISAKVLVVRHCIWMQLPLTLCFVFESFVRPQLCAWYIGFACLFVCFACSSFIFELFVCPQLCAWYICFACLFVCFALLVCSCALPVCTQP